MASKFNEIIQLLEGGFGSDSGKTPQFNAFGRKFKSVIKKALEEKGATLNSFSTGHFYCSGYYQVDDVEYFFSIPDVRSGRDRFLGDIMFRKQKQGESPTSSNQWGSFDDDSDLLGRMVK